MAVPLYMDHHVRRAVTSALRRRGVDVLTAGEDGAARLPDSSLLDRATALGRVLVTQDDDFLAEGAHRQRSGISFAGVIYSHQMKMSIADYIRNLEIIALAGDPADLEGRVTYLPL